MATRAIIFLFAAAIAFECSAAKCTSSSCLMRCLVVVSGWRSPPQRTNEQYLWCQRSFLASFHRMYTLGTYPIHFVPCLKDLREHCLQKFIFQYPFGGSVRRYQVRKIRKTPILNETLLKENLRLADRATLLTFGLS